MIPRRITNEEILQRRWAGGHIMNDWQHPHPADRREAARRVLRVAMVAILSALAFGALIGLVLAWSQP
jgi:hypothetical protein